MILCSGVVATEKTQGLTSAITEDGARDRRPD